MVKFPEAEARLFRNKFVCRGCKTVMHAPMAKILSGKICCRKCGARTLRPMRKK